MWLLIISLDGGLGGALLPRVAPVGAWDMGRRELDAGLMLGSVMGLEVLGIYLIPALKTASMSLESVVLLHGQEQACNT